MSESRRVLIEEKEYIWDSLDGDIQEALNTDWQRLAELEEEAAGAETKEDAKFAEKWTEARIGVDYFHMAHVLSERLRKMEKRCKAANKRADEAEATIRRISK